MGWKTITGSILIGIGTAAQAITGLDPMFVQFSELLIAVGVVLGGVGVRAAIAKK